MTFMANRRGRLGLPEQQAYMKEMWKGFNSVIKGKLLVCEGVVKPTPISKSYHVRVDYKMGSTPKAYVEDPPLQRRNPEENIPHTYEQDRPCLFYPGQWRSNMPIASSIIPWLYEWLFFYEGWLVTGEWQGGWIHPSSRYEPEENVEEKH